MAAAAALHGLAVSQACKATCATRNLGENPIHKVAPALHDLAQEFWDNGND